MKLILEDPALAGSVLQRANSAYYRTSPEPVDSLDRAVVDTRHRWPALSDGDRDSSAGVPPAERLLRQFRAGHLGAGAAQRRCRRDLCEGDASADPFIAQLLGLISALARIVLFRLTMDMYRERPNILPRAEVFIRSMQEHSPHVACLIASTWELSDPSIAALASRCAGCRRRTWIRSAARCISASCAAC